MSENNNTYLISGAANFCYTTKTNDSGKYPSHMYEVCIIPTEVPSQVAKFVNHSGKIKCKSKFPFRMYDKNSDPIKQRSVPNDTDITIAVQINSGNNGEYLSCKGIRFNSDVADYNPFR